MLLHLTLLSKQIRPKKIYNICIYIYMYIYIVCYIYTNRQNRSPWSKHTENGSSSKLHFSTVKQRNRLLSHRTIAGRLSRRNAGCLRDKAASLSSYTLENSSTSNAALLGGSMNVAFYVGCNHPSLKATSCSRATLNS